MLFLNMFRPHARFAAQAHAYADGELRGRELERFEAHLATCSRCEDAVAAASQLKAALRQLPEARAQRSFRISPVMLAGSPSSAAPRAAATPFYLGVARAAAGLAVVAFAGAFAFSALGGSDGGSGQADGNFRELSAPADGAPVPSGSKDQEYQPIPQESATAQIAPATTGGASGSSVETPVAPLMDPGADRSSSAPPGDGSQAGPALAEDDDAATSAQAVDLAVAQGAEDDEGVSAVVVGLGVIAAFAVVLLAGLEATRRARR